VADWLRDAAEGSSIALVGHLPFLDRLASLLITTTRTPTSSSSAWVVSSSSCRVGGPGFALALDTGARDRVAVRGCWSESFRPRAAFGIAAGTSSILLRLRPRAQCLLSDVWTRDHGVANDEQSDARANRHHAALVRRALYACFAAPMRMCPRPTLGSGLARPHPLPRPCLTPTSGCSR
jgi:hypothetical protein